MKAKNNETPLLSTVPAWLAMPLITLLVLALVAFALTRGERDQWQDFVLPAILGSILIGVMTYWLLHIRGVERRLREERNLLQVLINHLPDRVFIKDLAGRRLLSNPADWRAAGANGLEDVLGKNVFELYPPDLASKYAADDEEVLKTGEPILNREQPSVDAQGMPIWTPATEVPLRDTRKNLIGVVGIVRDITAIRQATEAERLAEERYHSIFENSVEGIYQTKPDGTIVAANPALARMLGYDTPDELMREMRNVVGRIYVDPARRGDFQAQIETTGTIAGFESEIRRKDGNTVWISENARVVCSPNGQVLYYEGTMVDITERKQAEKAQHRAEEKYHSFFENSIAGIFQTTMDGHYVEANPALAQMLGYESPEELMASVTDIEHELYVHESDRADLKRRLTRDGQVSGFEAELHRKDGSTFPALVNARLVSGSNGQPLYLEGTLVDISARKLVEQAQQETQRKQEVWIGALEQRTREISLLNSMSDLIQCCPTVEEAYTVIAQQVPWLFPQDSGALYILNSSRNLAEARVTWGERFDDPPAFKPTECWAFRRGQLHVMESLWADDPSMSEPMLVCNHIREPIPEASSCVPLIAQGETLGVLHLRHPKAAPSYPAASGVWYSDDKRELAHTVADSLALAISNLSLRDKLRQQSIRDPLTGLFNRRYMEESLAREIARSARSERPLGVMMLDIDHFKRFNDMFGHAAGDVVLRELGSLLSSHIREADIACRYGGEEFALILPEASLEVTRVRAEELREAIARLEAQQGGQLLGPITASFGVAEFPRHGRTGDAVVQVADAALYQAKLAGRDQVRVASYTEAKPSEDG